MRACASVVVIVLASGLVGAPACTMHQARTTQTTAEVVTASALGVMIASILAMTVTPPGHEALRDVGLACVPVALFGAGLYIGADQSLAADEEHVRRAPVQPTVSQTERANRRARELGHEAAAAARAGDCDQVRSLEERIAQLDENVHAASLRYAKIRACLPPVNSQFPIPGSLFPIRRE